MTMIYQNKIARFALCAMAGSFLASCNLDEELTSVYNADNAYVTEQNAQEGVNGIYRYLKGGTHPATFYLNDVSTDAAYKAGLDYEIMNDNNLAGNVDVARAYNGNWQMIGCANSAIDNITPMDESRFKDAARKKELLAEAHFMRAFAYYQLTNAFYRVPLITNGFYDAVSSPVLASVEALDSLMEQDLLIAASALPDTWEKKNVGGEGGRPTAGAAYGYLMRLYMRKAGYQREQGADASESWQAALNYANRVIATGRYALQPTIWDVFDPTSEKSLYNNEIIFAVRSSEKVPSGSSDIALYFTPWSYNYGWDIFSIPLELYWKYDATDQRFSKLLVGEYTDVYDANKKYKVPTRREVGTLNNESSSPIVVELAQAYTNKYFYEKAGTYNYNTPNNLILLRYADVLLCKAEILNELNGVNQTSLALLNQIRERAFGNTTHDYAMTDFTTKADFRSALCDERLLELNNEGCRRIDLIRMGLWKDRMDAYMDAIKSKVETKERNMGLTSGALSAEWSVYPKFSTAPLKRFDKRRYYPIPKVYSSKYPDLLNNRTFQEE
ncbi:RagB/SusD family nutrient uptake outer membrane protein [Prevotella sp. A2931]|uniref:RagB/SusD family nutrient uptake outer membrane protein n=2 Tax=Prevotellaceae TaxID=171552 RepID=A0ABS3M300_9BACT|nr:RagB/SusD family nutrient uptake outer membrane protein [Prevotella illustrans]PTL26722.1 RagB/SusD family nutrient uptake outer membrane protein [Prevotella sp. oral taxon 820]